MRLTPAHARLAPGATQQFTAFIDGAPAASATFSSNGGALAPSGGSVVFTAPAQPGFYAVTAFHPATPVRSGAAYVCVDANTATADCDTAPAPVPALEVSPSSLSVLPGARREFFARLGDGGVVAVNWSATGGSFVANAPFITYTAPPQPGLYQLTATSQSNPGLTGRATVEVVPSAVSVTMLPWHLTVYRGQLATLSARVSGSINTAVTWSAPSGGEVIGGGNAIGFRSNTPGTYTLTATSAADPGQSATVTVVVTANTVPSSWTSPATPVPCTPAANGRTFEVGAPGGPQSLSQIDWNDLRPGDTVRVHHRAAPYAERFVISTQGTASNPIRICGVPDANGNLPVLTGVGATLDDALTTPELQRLGILHVRKRDFSALPTYPRYISIEGLRIQSAHRNVSHSTGPYEPGAACIRVHNGGDILIRGNEIADCENGIFTNAQVAEAGMVRNVVMDGNYIHDNGGFSGDDRRHNVYVQAVGVVTQFNHFGRVRPESAGINYKSRSAAEIIRYNYLEGAARVLDLVEPQAHWSYVFSYAFDEHMYEGLQSNSVDPTPRPSIVATEEAYNHAYVYGNIIKNDTPVNARYPMHYGSDGDARNARRGTLYFFHNTLVNNDSNSVFDQGYYYGSPEYGRSEAYNNLLELVATGNNVFTWTRYRADRLVLGRNYSSSSWSANSSGGLSTRVWANFDPYPEANASHHTEGMQNLVTGSVPAIHGTSFEPLTNGSGPQVREGAAALPASLAQYAPTLQLRRDPATGQFRAEPRAPLGSADVLSLGAVEPRL